MKILITTLFVALMINHSMAQADNRDPLVGTWQWHNHTDTFTVKFKKVIYTTTKGEKLPFVYGYYTYKENGKIIFTDIDNYDKEPIQGEDNIDLIYSKQNTFVGSFIDNIVDDDKDLKITLSPDQKSLLFEVSSREPRHSYQEGEKIIEYWKFSIPQSMTLTKVEDIPVVVLPPPTLSTGGFTNLGYYTATLHGAINPKGNTDTKVFFEYGTSTDYGKSIIATPATVSGNTPVSVSANISGLTANNTTYHYRLVATANASVYYGEDKTFTTPYDAPTMENLREIEILSQSATITGMLNAHNLGQYNVSIEYQNAIPNSKIQNADAQPLLIEGNTNTPFVAELKGLLPGYQYRCRIVCSIGAKTYYGDYFYFTTVYKPGPLEGDKTKE